MMRRSASRRIRFMQAGGFSVWPRFHFLCVLSIELLRVLHQQPLMVVRRSPDIMRFWEVENETNWLKEWLAKAYQIFRALAQVSSWLSLHHTLTYWGNCTSSLPSKVLWTAELVRCCSPGPRFVACAFQEPSQSM